MNANESVRILLVDDNPNDRVLALQELKKQFPTLVAFQIGDERSLRDALNNPDFDLVITDFSLLWTDGLTVLQQVKSRYPNCPVIMFTGTGNEEIAVNAMKLGLDDYIVKKPQHYKRLRFAAQNALESARLRKAKAEAESRYQSLFKDNFAVMLIADPDTAEIVDANPAACAYYGYDIDTFKTKKVKDFCTLPPEAILAILQTAKSGSQKHEILRHRLANGEIRDVEVYIGPILLSGKNFLYAIVHDITEKKQYEDALHASEAKYRELVQNANSIILRWNREGAITFLNEFGQSFFGFSEREILGKPIMGTIVEERDESGRNLVDMFNGMIEHPELYTNNINQNVCRDGRKVWIAWTNKAIKDENGNTVEMFSVGSDITERKMAETALQESEELFRNLFEKHAAIKLIVDPETGNIVDANEAAAIFYKWSRERLKQMKIQEINTLPPDRMQLEMDKVLSGKCTPFEFRHKIADGSIRDVEVYSSKIQSKGKIFLHSIVLDITQRKRAEEKLWQSEMLLAEAQRIAKIGSWDLNLVENQLLWSNEVYRIFEIDPGEFDGTNEAFLERIYPEDRPRVEKAYADSLKNHAPYSVDLRLLMKGGRIKFVHEQCETFYNSEGTPIHSIGTIQDITERKQAEETLRQSEERYRQFFEQDLTGVLISSVDGRIVDCNPAYLKIFRIPSKEEALATNIALFYQDPKARENFLQLLQEKKELFGIEKELRRMDGNPVYMIENNIGIFNDRGELVEIRSYIFDNTERKVLEEQFRQAQKMEAVGRLAGGVAHDFNNIIMAIRGYGDLVLRALPKDHITRMDIQEIKKTADRAASLTRQLLAFARKETVSPTALDLNNAVSNIMKMIQRLVGEDISLVWMPGQNLYWIKIDPSQLDQILVNLAVNARDAIAGVGKIIFETSNTEFNEAYCASHVGSIPGEYVLLAVSDDGCGMDKDTLSKIFELFFTTKKLGKGTGLGLPAVFGAVKQNGGFINVYSEPGHGTTFRIYLPRYAGDVLPHSAAHVEVAPQQGKETILLIEDDVMILDIGRRMLEELGYTVLAANTPKEAIRLAETTTNDIDLLITDVVMPKMSGRELAERLLSIKPDLKCLFMSGYTANVIAHSGILESGIHFIQKPFSEEMLAASVRQVLDIS
ncbi:MAG: PAS domain S-box protein [Candidatus Omnitrophota bacterium]